MGYPEQPQGQGRPGSPGNPWSPGPQAGGAGDQDQTQVPGGGYPPPSTFPQPGSYQQPGGYPPPGGYQQGGTGQQPGGFGMPPVGQVPQFGQPGWSGSAPGYPARKNNSLAVASLVCGIAQFVLWWLFGIGFFSAIAAFVLGLVSIRQIRDRGEGGRGMAIAGTVLGGLGILGGILIIILLVALGHSSSFSYNFGN